MREDGHGRHSMIPQVRTALAVRVAVVKKLLRLDDLQALHFASVDEPSLQNKERMAARLALLCCVHHGSRILLLVSSVCRNKHIKVRWVQRPSCRWFNLRSIHWSLITIPGIDGWESDKFGPLSRLLLVECQRLSRISCFSQTTRVTWLRQPMSVQGNYVNYAALLWSGALVLDCIVIGMLHCWPYDIWGNACRGWQIYEPEHNRTGHANWVICALYQPSCHEKMQTRALSHRNNAKSLNVTQKNKDKQKKQRESRVPLKTHLAR